MRPKSYEEFRVKFEIFKKMVVHNLENQWERMKCHPTIGKHVTPVVEQIWHLVPLNIILGPVVTSILDIISCPLWIITCWSWLFVLPWNMTCGLAIVMTFLVMLISWPICFFLAAQWHFWLG